MNTPQTIGIYRGGTLYYNDFVGKSDDLPPLCAIPGTLTVTGRSFNGVRGYDIRSTVQLPAWNGHQFEVVHAKLRTHDNSVVFNFDRDYEFTMFMYLPVDKRTQVSDWEGAIRAYPNETNTAWLPAHTEEGTHHDYELTLIGACDGLFGTPIRLYQTDAITAKTTQAKERAESQFVKLTTFYGATVAELRKLARLPFLGEREQQAHPREGWLDRDLTAAIAAVETAQAEAIAADPPITTAITYIKNQLAMPSVETRWARVARLAAEKRAAEEAAANAAQEAADGQS